MPLIASAICIPRCSNQILYAMSPTRPRVAPRASANSNFTRRNRERSHSADKLFCWINKVRLTPSSLPMITPRENRLFALSFRLRSRANPDYGPRGTLPRCRPDGGGSFPIDRLPEGQQCLLKAWSYDAEACRAYRLEGSATVTR